MIGAAQPASKSHFWLSADGTADGLIRRRPVGSPDQPDSYRDHPLSGCRNGRRPVRDKDDKVIPGSSQRCEPRPGYLHGLPTDADEMLRYLHANSQGQNGRDTEAFMTAADLITTAHLPSGARAALFEALAKIPGVSVAGDITDVAGRPGTAVVMNHNGMRDYLIFDVKTHAYLGRQETVADSGDLVWAEAQLRVAAVNRAGQLP